MIILSQELTVSQALAERRLNGHKKLGGDTARTADPNYPKGYSIAWGVMLSV